MAAPKVTAFKFSDEELELLGVIQGHTGVGSRMEALRAVMKYYVEAEGLDPKASGAERALDPKTEKQPAK